MKQIIQSSLRKAQETRQQLIAPLAVEQIKKAIQTCAEMLHEELTDTKAEYWSKLVANYPPDAVIWAFDNWTRNGDYFPKPKDIRQLVETWCEQISNEFQTCGKCSNGWVIVNPEGKMSEHKARRCGCIPVKSR